MTFESQAYVKSLSLGGKTGWRLPTPQEAIQLLNHDANNPAIDTKFFPPALQSITGQVIRKLAMPRGSGSQMSAADLAPSQNRDDQRRGTHRFFTSARCTDRSHPVTLCRRWKWNDHGCDQWSGLAASGFRRADLGMRDFGMQKDSAWLVLMTGGCRM